MIQTIVVHSTDGSMSITTAQVSFQINDKQSIAVIGMPDDSYPELDEESQPDFEYMRLGKFEEQGFPMNRIIINSLNIELWDWDKYPNPEIILITKKFPDAKVR